jgi:hypothetical protein
MAGLVLLLLFHITLFVCTYNCFAPSLGPQALHFLSLLNLTIAVMAMFARKSSVNAEQYHCSPWPEYVEGALAALCRQEPTYHSTSNMGSISKNHKTNKDTGVCFSPEHRRCLSLWTYRMLDYFDLSRSLAAYAMSYFDRFLTRQRDCRDPAHLKFILAASLHLACTLHSGDLLQAKRLIEALPPLTQGEFSQQNIILMRDMLLRVLTYKVHPPLPFRFIDEICTILIPLYCEGRNHPCVLQGIHNHAAFFAELAVTETKLVSVRPSVIASAAILNGADMVVEGSSRGASSNDEDHRILLAGILQTMIPDFDLEQVTLICNGLKLLMDQAICEEDETETYKMSDTEESSTLSELSEDEDEASTLYIISPRSVALL